MTPQSHHIAAYRMSQLALILLMLSTAVMQVETLQNVQLSSTENSITLTFIPSPTAVNYTVSFRISTSIFMNDFTQEPPPDGSSLSFVYEDVIPGFRYVVDAFEIDNTTTLNKVFEREIATVPLRPQNVRVVTRGSTFLFLDWISTQNLTYEGYEITYTRENGSRDTTKLEADQTFYNLTNLYPGHNYNIYIQAYVLEARSQRSDQITESTAPLPPTNLTAEALSTSAIRLVWDADPSSFQESFIVNYSVVNSNVDFMVACVESPCEFSPDAQAGETINIIVFAISHSVTSTAALIQHSTAPGIVTGLDADSGVRNLTLRWNPPEKSFQVSYVLNISSTLHKVSQNQVYTVPSTSTSYILDSLTGGAIYNVQVRAQSEYELGESSYKVFKTLPEPVTNFTGSPVNTTAVYFSWINPMYSEFNGLNISIYMPDGEVVFSEEVESTLLTSYEVSSLVPGQQYQVGVAVMNPYTPSSQEIRIPVSTKPVVPTVVTSVSSETSLTLTLAPSDESGVLDSIQAIIGNSTNQLSANENGQVIFTDLEPGMEYTITTFSISGQVFSDMVTQMFYTRPLPVQNLVVIAVGERSLNVTWDEPLSGGYDNFTVLVSELDSITTPMVRILSSLETTFEDLQPGTTYNVSVIAFKGDQNSEELWDTNTTTPLAVTHVRVAVRGIDTITLAWDAPVGSALAGFALTFDPLNMTLTPLAPEIDQFKFEGLQPDTNYSVQIFTFSRRSEGDLVYSAATSFNFSTYPESVAALQKVESLTDSITVNWTAPTSVNIDFFQLGIKAVDPATKPDPLPKNVAQWKTNETFSDLEPGLEYTIAIRTAKRMAGNRVLYGVSVRMRAVTMPLPVQQLRAESANSTALAVKWETDNTSRQDEFRIKYTAEDSSKSFTVPAVNESSASYQMDIGQLLAGYKYSVSVTAVRMIETDLAESDQATAEGYTFPLPVRDLVLQVEGPSDLQVTWSPPASGKWKSYKVTYRPILLNPDSEFLLRTSGQSQTSMTITDLFPGERYQIRVVSVSNDLDSDMIEAEVVQKPLPPLVVEVNTDLTTTDSATLTWTYDFQRTFTEHWQIATSAASPVSTLTVDASQKMVEYSVEVVSLVAGQTYDVAVTAVVEDQSSDPYTLQVTAKPVMNSLLTAQSSTNSSITLIYTVVQEDIFDHILFTLLDHPAFEQIHKTKSDPKQVITFEGLEAGTIYTVRAATVSNGEASDSKTLAMITEPNPVPVTLTSTSTSITLNLGPQQGMAAKYVVQCTTGSGGSCGQTELVAALDRSEQVAFNGLEPYTVYGFEIVTKTELLNEEMKEVSQTLEFRTDEAAPSAVRSLQLQEDGIHTVVLTWQAPEKSNGVLRSYTVAYQGSEPTDTSQRDMKILKDLSVSSTTKTVNALKAGYTYKFSVYARTVAQGEAAEQTITLGTKAPAFKQGLDAVEAKPVEMEKTNSGDTPSVTQTQIPLTFVNPFSDENGAIRSYTVIVSKDPTAHDSMTSLPSWSDAQADSKIQVYQTLGQCPDFFSRGSSCGKSGGGGNVRKRRAANNLDSRTFIIGDQADCNGKEFCNGPLDPDTDYYIKLRGFTASGEFEETEYSEKIRTANIKDLALKAKGSTSNGGLIGGVISAVVAVVVVIIAVVVVRRRRHRPKQATKHVGPKTNWEQSTMCKFSRPVKLVDFTAHVRKMAADSDFKYAEEYEDLKEIGRDQPCLAAEFPPNRPKNRFTNILPYDHSRVKLLPTDDDEGSDYINANYMPGFNSKREYIATQGPLPATRDDFWRMLWEQSSRNIVMLTRCQEKGREKSDHYWPNDSDPKFYGDLHVVILNETHMPDWTVTEFKVSLGEKSRTVRHFHYRVWPDFGVPKDPTSLIRFVRMVREKLIREGGPILTHCSAGVGRSGTFIVLDHLLQMIREKDEVDIFSIVYRLRKERVLMVQTERFRPRAELQEYFSLQQYKFLHECLMCVLEGKEDDTTYANVGQINVGFDDDEGINIVEVP